MDIVSDRVEELLDMANDDLADSDSGDEEDEGETTSLDMNSRSIKTIANKNNQIKRKSTNNMTLRNTTSTHHCNACNGQQCAHTCGKKSKKSKKNYNGGREYYKPLVVE